MPDDGFKLLEALTCLTEERDTRSLEKVLFHTLSGLVSFDALILLRLPRHSDDKSLEMAQSLPENAYEDKLNLIMHEFGEPGIIRDEGINQCIGSGAIVSIGSDNERILFPLLAHDEVIGVLNIYGCQCNAQTIKLVQGFVQVYSNFLTVLNDSEHDTLTGLLNRKTFDAKLIELYSIDAIKDKTQLSARKGRRKSKKVIHHQIGILDIDLFKRINDNFGHVYGDEVLILFADMMRKIFRSSDFLFRFGGEEFVVVLLNVSGTQAYNIFERFRTELEKVNFPQVGRVTVSIGMANLDSQCHSTILLERVDQALYYAKEHGRNQVCNYHELVKKGHLYEMEFGGQIDLF